MNEIQINRNEIKYELHPLEALELQNELDILLQRDEHSMTGSYMVRSLYFDSINDIDYMEKFAGEERRKKVRIRIYTPNAQKGKFEIKQKHGNYSHKQSLPVSAEEIRHAMNGEYSFLLEHPSETALQLYSLLSLGLYRPKAIVEYQRVAYQYEENNIRITLDSEIKSSESDLNLLNDTVPYFSVLDDKVILEVKYNGALLKVISDVLKKYQLMQISVSKYAMSRPVWAKYI